MYDPESEHNSNKLIQTPIGTPYGIIQAKRI